MLSTTDIRFKADGRQASRVRQIHFPMRLRILRPTAVQALFEARRVVDQLRQAAGEAELPGARLIVPDLDADSGLDDSELTIEQKSQREVRLQITLVVSLIPEGADTFWSYAMAVASATDFLQSFSLRPHEKGVEVDPQQARALGAGVSPPEAGTGEQA